MLPKAFMVALLALLSAAVAKREDMNRVSKAMNAEAYEVSQEQAELATKEAEAMMAGAVVTETEICVDGGAARAA